MAVTLEKARAVSAQRHVRMNRTVGSPHCKWMVLSNTTLGLLMATISASILLLWLIMGYMVITAVPVASMRTPDRGMPARQRTLPGHGAGFGDIGAGLAAVPRPDGQEADDGT